ncbi:MAG: 7-cyano-7-deazaguanine synthase [Minisyncoccota bacterium]
MKKPKTALVLFSGGRDSSAAAVELAKQGYMVRLYTCQNGSELCGPQGDSAPDIRHKELVKAFPDNIEAVRIIEDKSYLIRKLGIEKTNVEYVIYPLVLALATHSFAVRYCHNHKIKIMASGYSGHQSKKENKYIEQRNDFVNLTKKLLKEYGISYLTPVINKTELEVKDILEQHGISSNSLEIKSIFGGIPYDIKKSLGFWEASLPICKDFIKSSKQK